MSLASVEVQEQLERGFGFPSSNAGPDRVISPACDRLHGVRDVDEVMRGTSGRDPERPSRRYAPVSFVIGVDGIVGWRSHPNVTITSEEQKTG